MYSTNIGLTYTGIRREEVPSPDLQHGAVPGAFPLNVSFKKKNIFLFSPSAHLSVLPRVDPLHALLPVQLRDLLQAPLLLPPPRGHRQPRPPRRQQQDGHQAGRGGVQHGFRRGGRWRDQEGKHTVADGVRRFQKEAGTGYKNYSS